MKTFGEMGIFFFESLCAFGRKKMNLFFVCFFFLILLPKGVGCDYVRSNKKKTQKFEKHKKP